MSGAAFGKITSGYGHIDENGSSVCKRPARKKAITDKMGEKYLERYKKHFKSPDIRKHCLKHEELLACYPKLWSEEVAGCCGF
ncbi:hypothetical protein [Ligilactobacillus ruminis]|uniref:hypothetical protein n=1 Tax=Ligilactobacillus ruminis TaxID=1623 RepID=UPI0022E56C13|nr:hypothetical protein [Ligilactobacillus ruminis]